MNAVVNIAGYKFVALDDPSSLRAQLKSRCSELSLKGTILLSAEGINAFLAGSRTAIDDFLATLRADARFADMQFKESLSNVVPFQRLLVKVKREIIAGDDAQPSLDPRTRPAPRIAAEQLKQWLDEGRDITLLDTRNDFEVSFGTFAGAQQLHLKNFREFAAKAAQQTNAEARARTIVTFCTGGIRCEKAAPMLLAQGYTDVYQLDGGILEYFKRCGGAHYDGQCFVFDERVALDAQLQPLHDATTG